MQNWSSWIAVGVVLVVLAANAWLKLRAARRQEQAWEREQGSGAVSSIPSHPRHVDHDRPMPEFRDPCIEKFGDMNEFGRAIEYGWVEYVSADGQTLHADVKVDPVELRKFLVADAERNLPPNTRFELRRKVLNYKRTFGMAWYRCGFYQDKVEDWIIGPIEHEHIISRHITPGVLSAENRSPQARHEAGKPINDARDWMAEAHRQLAEFR